MINTYLVSIFNYNCWFKNNECHRHCDLPAVEWNNGSKWFKNGKCHREGELPAVKYSNGNKYWYKNDTRYFPIEQYIIINAIIIKIKIMKMGDKWWYTFHN